MLLPLKFCGSLIRPGNETFLERFLPHGPKLRKALVGMASR